MFAQSRVPSGFDLGLGCSGAGAGAAGTASADTCSQDGSGFILSVSAEPNLLAVVSVMAALSHVDSSAASPSSILGTDSIASHTRPLLHRAVKISALCWMLRTIHGGTSDRFKKSASKV